MYALSIEMLSIQRYRACTILHFKTKHNAINYKANMPITVAECNVRDHITTTGTYQTSSNRYSTTDPEMGDAAVSAGERCSRHRDQHHCRHRQLVAAALECVRCRASRLCPGSGGGSHGLWLGERADALARLGCRPLPLLRRGLDHQLECL